ncbi:MAG TPA: histidine kinase, partial [Verrucomicrobiae bacterium]|nr:histidine kinase [Verrucomicrobiae bacterium]
MDATRAGDDTRAVRDARIDGLRAEASEAVGYSANTLRTVSQRYRTAYAEQLGRWQGLRDELDAIERIEADGPRHPAARDRSEGDGAGSTPAGSAPDSVDAAAEAAEAGAEDGRQRDLRLEVEVLGRELGTQQTELAKLEIALRNLESTWLFLERGDSSLVNEPGDGLPTDLQMRIVEAQESERSRLAQEVHDGPAQVLSNAIFQVEYIERVIDTDERAARTELRFLRDLLRRELGSVRTFISQLRPPVLDELGLDGAIADAIGRVTALTGLAISTQLAA